MIAGRGGGDRDRNGGGGWGDSGGNDVRGLPRGPRGSGGDDYGGPSAAEILAPKKREEEKILQPVAAPLALPGEDEAAAKARIEKKKREVEERAEEERKAAEEAARIKAEAETKAAKEATKAASMEGTMLAAFASGDKLGPDLAAWCAQQESVLPSVEKLVYHLLTEVEKKNPDKECSWALTEKYGAALVSLVEDNILGQMQVLWGIQKVRPNL